MLEHYRFRLLQTGESQGVGQGKAKPGDVLGQANPQSGPGQKGAGGKDQGGIELMLEFKVDDVIDWLWEDLKLPNLQPRAGATEESEWKREGWDRRGARSRLDRRRSLKESVKRRALDEDSPAFTDEDLRYRQLTRRRQPALRAAVFFLLDVSGSMSDRDRQLAKTFFFWVAAGLRREYKALDIVFVAHTTDAWEFSEADFFKVAGSGGTVASVGFAKVREIMLERFDPGSCNVYLFYASDGDNASDDRTAAAAELETIAKAARYAGYVEISAGVRSSQSETMAAVRDRRRTRAGRAGAFPSAGPDDIAAAVRHFFTAEANTSGDARRTRSMSTDWRSHVPQLEDLARKLGLDWSQVIFEAVPDSFMTEIAVYGLPVRMPHWSFGARYIYQLLQRHMGYSRLFEVVFPGDPGHAYLAASNGLADNVLVTAHVLGHADFSKNNMLFRRCQDQGSAHIIEHAASHARQIERAHRGLRLQCGRAGARCRPVPRAIRRPRSVVAARALSRIRADAGGAAGRSVSRALRDARLRPPLHRRLRKVRAPLPPHPERDLLWFIATYAPEMESWERDIFLAVRDESFYFYPGLRHADHERGLGVVLACAAAARSGFHPRGNLPRRHQVPLGRGAAGGDRRAGRSDRSIPIIWDSRSWEEIVKKSGMDAARRVMREDDDCSFLRNYLTREIAEEMGLFRYQRQQQGQVKVVAADIEELHENLLPDKYNFGAPRVSVAEVRNDGTLVLAHDSQLDGRGLDAERAGKVLEYIKRVWRRPVLLNTVDADAKAVELSSETPPN